MRHAPGGTFTVISSAAMCPSPGQAEPEPTSFEGHLQALERVVADLEGDALSLEASIARYQQGVAHLAACRTILDGAEQRLAELVATTEGGVAHKPLEVGPEGLIDASPSGRGVEDAPAKSRPKTPRKAPPSGRAMSSDPGEDLPF